MYRTNVRANWPLFAGFVAVVLLVCPSAHSEFAFGPPENLGPAVNSSAGEGTINVSGDGLEMYFSSNRPGGLGYEDLWVSTRQDVDDPWGPPVNLGPPVDSSYRESYPSVSADGLTLYFSDYFYRPDRPGGVGGHDLWVATRPSRNDPWGEPTNLGAGVNSPVDDEAPSLSHDGLTLLFSSQRAGTRGWDDLWICTRPTTQDPWGQPVNLGPVVNSDSYELYGQLSPDGLVLFFESDRPGGLGRYDIWMTRRKSRLDTWGPPVNVGPPVNTVGEDGLGSLSADGKTLYFASDRPGGVGGWDIWQVSISPVVDFNGDGIVDLKDFSKLALHWGRNESSVDVGRTPFGDGIVDVGDVAVLADYWLKDGGVIAHWKLDETEGFVAHDSAGEHDGTLLSANPLWRPSDGKVNGALELDGVDDFVSAPFVLNPADGDFSVFAWIKGGAPGQVVISQAGGANWLSADASEGTLATDLAIPPGGRFLPEPLVSQSIITDDNWHNAGFVWDGSNRILYVDDVEVAKDTQSRLAGSDGALCFGAGKDKEPGSFFSGLIDDVKIYDRAIVP